MRRDDGMYDYTFPEELREALFKRMLEKVKERPWEVKEDYVWHVLIAVEDEIAKYLTKEFPDKEDTDELGHVPDKS